jgi:5-methylthioadenosine/S-adenosylhomocysteine deaminase
MPTSFSISGATLVTPTKVHVGHGLRVEEDVIGAMGRGRSSVAKQDFRLPAGMFVYPALINIHDHMRGNYLPRVGPSGGRFYKIWSDWNDDLHASKTVAERNRALGIDDIYSLSSYKNIVSGVATVHDHFPHEWNEPFVSRQPLRVVREYAIAHDASKHALPWGSGIKREHGLARKHDWPFITHLEEGFDAEIQSGVDELERLKCLDEYTVMVHCIGFSDQDIASTARAGAHVVWCAASNIYMFNVTCRVRKMLTAGVNVSIGTDSTHTGAINILEEVRFARQTYRQMYNADLAASALVNMMTANPARALRIDSFTGTLTRGKQADLLVVEPRHSDPYEALVAARIADVELLTCEGRPLFGSPRFEELFAQADRDGFGCYTRVAIEGKEKLIVGDPGATLHQMRETIGYHKVLDFLPLDLAARRKRARTGGAKPIRTKTPQHA